MGIIGDTPTYPVVDSAPTMAAAGMSHTPDYPCGSLPLVSSFVHRTPLCGAPILTRMCAVMVPLHQHSTPRCRRDPAFYFVFPCCPSSHSTHYHDSTQLDACPCCQWCQFSFSPLAPPWTCLLYTSPSPRDATLSRMPSSA